MNNAPSVAVTAMTTKKTSKEVYPITTFISDLPTSLIPRDPSSSTENGPQPRRLVIVGDVHGMSQSLEKLLTRVNFDKDHGDHLILAGDLTNKGPDSSGVVDLAMKLGASAVRGNHDNAVLDAAAEIAAKGSDLINQIKTLNGSSMTPGKSQANLPEDDSLPRKPETSQPPAAGMLMRHGATTYNTAMHLSRRQIDWLAALPLILCIHFSEDTPSSLGHNLVVAHAGLVPGVPLEKQDPHAVLHMRSFTRSVDGGHSLMPDEAFGEEGWAVEWDRWQDSLPRSRTTVVFGHDAKRRLQLGKYTIGLDTACLYGNQLSALVISVKDARIEHEIVQVDCADTPVAPTGPPTEEKKTVVDE